MSAANHPAQTGPRPAHPLLGTLLVNDGILAPAALHEALQLQKTRKLALGDLVATRGMAEPEDIMRALAAQHGLEFIDLAEYPCDPELRDRLSLEDILHFGAVPWRQAGNRLFLATPYPERIAQARRRLGLDEGALDFVICTQEEAFRAIRTYHRAGLVTRAETRVAAKDSCRAWSVKRSRAIGLSLVLALALFALAAPSLAFLTALGAATALLFANSVLKLICAMLALGAPKSRTEPAIPDKLPRISLLVPLHRERNIADALIARLARLTYPTDLIEVFLIVEASDLVTQGALSRSELPLHFRVVTVPGGTLHTKPRAMNYALDFTQGEIIGVYDAEDAPDPDQLYKIAARFAAAPPHVVCLQGILSFYNPTRSWLSRCFSFEYAAWFRVMLPGLARLGLAIPLGGTTVFFRREALCKLGAWDAHNVTEDADLGIRLARRGYLCEMIETVTQEEATSRLWPWIRQRSRWLKGYAVTWAVHMRRPLALWRDLGARRFFGFQLMFLGALAAFFLAPVLWLQAFLTLTGTSPLAGSPTAHFLAAGFLAAEALAISVYLLGHAQLGDRPARIWVLTLPIYFVFGTVAALKGVLELAFRPFYWDKTDHGDYGGRDWQALPEPLASGDEALDKLARDDLQPGLERDREMRAQRV